jgi:Uma2 family endonuclease
MTPATAEPSAADILAALGDIPPHRLIWLPRPAIEEDVIRRCDREPKRLVELVDGFLVEKAMGNREALFATSLLVFLATFVRQRNLGVVGAPDAIMRLRAGLIRLPDVYFTAWGSLPSDTAHLRPVADYPPDLVVEILSENNTPREIERKRQEYFAAGAKLMWVIDPEARVVAVYAGKTGNPVVLTAADALDGGAVLPGFTLPLAELFDDPQLNPRT